jgi:glutamyl-tRNA(Gln) amidotransferase subunit D
MKVKTFGAGDRVKIRTRGRSWEGYVLESHDSEIILLKLASGYNIGIREGDVLDAKVLAHDSVPSKVGTKVPSSSGKAADRSLPNVAIVITGGTISSRLDPKSGGVISTDKETILNIAPEIREICNPVLVSPFMKFSENMSSKDWQKIAEVCEKYLNDDSIKGVVITHGTDFLHYTSAALSFFLKGLNKPVALTYSQRSIDRASTDAALNLVCAVKYAVSDVAEVALVGHKNTDDEVCLAMPATRVRKMHTSRRDAFKIVNDDPIVEISKDEFKILREFNARSDRKVKVDSKFEDRVALVHVYPGQDPAILDFYLEQKYKGIILEVTGIGQVPTRGAKFNWLPKIKNAIRGGVVVCATAQTIYGRLNPNIYSAGRDLEKTGIIFLDDMLSETALVKLGWVLGHKKWNVKEKMLENSPTR